MLALIWSLALCGVMLKVRWMDAPRWLSVALYLGMGWIAVIAASELLRAVPSGGIAWVLSGGLVYSAGALAYGSSAPTRFLESSGSTRYGTSSSWREAPAISGQCYVTSRRWPRAPAADYPTAPRAPLRARGRRPGCRGRRGPRLGSLRGRPVCPPRSLRRSPDRPLCRGSPSP